MATGQVIAQCKPRHRHQEFLSFLRHIDANVPPGLDVHLVVDNYSTHKHAKVKRWLAARPRYHLHFTPTYSSWFNQVEIWFNIITQKAIRRGSFSSVTELKEKILGFTEHYNNSGTQPSCGPPPRTPSYRRSRDYVRLSLGHDTSAKGPPGARSE